MTGPAGFRERPSRGARFWRTRSDYQVVAREVRTHVDLCSPTKSVSTRRSREPAESVTGIEERASGAIEFAAQAVDEPGLGHRTGIAEVSPVEARVGLVRRHQGM